MCIQCHERLCDDMHLLMEDAVCAGTSPDAGLNWRTSAGEHMPLKDARVRAMYMAEVAMDETLSRAVILIFAAYQSSWLS